MYLLPTFSWQYFSLLVTCNRHMMLIILNEHACDYETRQCAEVAWTYWFSHCWILTERTGVFVSVFGDLNIWHLASEPSHFAVIIQSPPHCQNVWLIALAMKIAFVNSPFSVYFNSDRELKNLTKRMEDQDNCEFCHLAYLTLVCRTEGLLMASGQSDRFFRMASVCRNSLVSHPQIWIHKSVLIQM